VTVAFLDWKNGRLEMKQQSTSSKQVEGATRTQALNRAEPQKPASFALPPVLRLQQTIGNRAVQRLIDLSPNGGRRSGQGSLDTPQLATVLNRALGSPGQGLDPAIRWFMESRFRKDFGGVTMHADSAAAESAKAVNAKAYTVGQHIAFKDGEYSAHSAEGQRLIAHELTHVVQQARAATPAIAEGELSISEAADDSERAAEATATEVMKGGIPGRDPVGTAAAGESAVQREGESDENPVLGGISNLLGLGGSVAGAFGQEGIGNALGAAGKGMDSGGAAAKGDVPGAVSPLLDVAGTVASGLGFNGIGALAKGASSGLDVGKAFGKGDPLDEAKSVQSAVGGLAEAGGFNLAEAGGMGLGELGGLGAAGVAGSAAAVAGAGLAGWQAGKGLDQLSNYVGQKVTGDKAGDYSISGGLAKGMTAVDQAVSPLWADPSKPAYTQTLGWKLANMFG